MREVTLVVQNIGRGAGALDAHPGMPREMIGAQRWPMLVERLKTVTWTEPDGTATTVTPALVALNECEGWDWARLETAAADLGLQPLGICTEGSGNAPAMLYDPAQFGADAEWFTKHSNSSHHGLGLAGFAVPGLPDGKRLGVCVSHLTPFDPDAAKSEAHLVACRAYRYGGYAVALGDFNYLPLVGRHSYDTGPMTAYNWANRFHFPRAFYWQPTGRIGRAIRSMLLKVQRPRPNLKVAKAFHAMRLADAAALMYQRTRNKQYLAWTCPSMRIDWICLSPALAEALVDYQVITSPEWASDHHAVAVRLDLDRIDHAKANWDYH